MRRDLMVKALSGGQSHLKHVSIFCIQETTFLVRTSVEGIIHYEKSVVYSKVYTRFARLFCGGGELCSDSIASMLKFVSLETRTARELSKHRDEKRRTIDARVLNILLGHGILE